MTFITGIVCFISDDSISFLSNKNWKEKQFYSSLQNISGIYVKVTIDSNLTSFLQPVNFGFHVHVGMLL